MDTVVNPKNGSPGEDDDSPLIPAFGIGSFHFISLFVTYGYGRVVQDWNQKAAGWWWF